MEWAWYYLRMPKHSWGSSSENKVVLDYVKAYLKLAFDNTFSTLIIQSSNHLAGFSFVTLIIHICNGLNDKNLVKAKESVLLLFNCFIGNIISRHRKYDFVYSKVPIAAN